MTEQVRETLGANIARIRTRRGMTVRDLSARLNQLGLRLSPTGVSEIEATPQKKTRRKVSVDELLVIAIALNTSVIDLLTPPDGSALAVADETEPLEPWWLEKWLQGEFPLPQEMWSDSLTEFDTAQLDEFHAATSERRRTMHRRDARPEIVAIDKLRERVRRAIEATEDPGAAKIIADSRMPPKKMAANLRSDLEDVSSSVNLLAKIIERDGYASR